MPGLPEVKVEALVQLRLDAPSIGNRRGTAARRFRGGPGTNLLRLSVQGRPEAVVEALVPRRALGRSI